MTAVDNLFGRAPTTLGMLPTVPACALRGAADYPRRLELLPRPPACLWYRGRLPGGKDAAAGEALLGAAGARPGAGPGASTRDLLVAIVGARAASRAACERAFALAQALGRRGYGVVSGGAFGVDAAGHRGALAVGAPTFAVLGCGVDVVYPDPHAGLFDQIALQGGLLSEHPPGTPPRARQFPGRNRLIAALARVVVVVEAGWQSGSLGTARLARSLGVPVVATPGSPGTDALLAAGTAHEDGGGADGLGGVLQALAGAPVAPPTQLSLPASVPGGAAQAASPALAAILAVLQRATARPEVLVARVGLPLQTVMAELTLAEIDGWVRRAPDGAYEVTRGR